MKTFLDTSVLLAGLIDFGPQSAPAQSILHAVAEKSIAEPGTAWHCCLEFFSVATRLPPEFRLTPADACRLIGDELLSRLAVHDLPSGERQVFLRSAAADSIAGGARVVVTDNRRHFLAALRHGLRVETPAEFLARRR